MSYMDPRDVLSPKGHVGDVKVVYDGGAGSWSIARLSWDAKPAVGIRWNGEATDNGIGNPQSRGHPTWFIVPADLEEAVLQRAGQLAMSVAERLAAGYREMAADSQREQDAGEWTEGLIGDAGRE